MIDYRILLLGGLIDGVWLWWWLGPREVTVRERLAVGSVIGLAGVAWVGYLSGLVFGPGRVAGRVAEAVVLGLLGVVAVRVWKQKEKGWSRLAWPGVAWHGVAYYAGWAVLLGVIFGRVAEEVNEGILTAPANNFGDLGFHMSVISWFEYGGALPPENPIFAGLPLTYPFLIDYLTAMLLERGASLRAGFGVAGWILGLSLVVIIEGLATRLTGSRLAGRLAPVIFIFSGGLGFVRFFGEVKAFLADPVAVKSGLIWFLGHLPASYSINNTLTVGGAEIALRYGNVVTTMLVPQRSMLFGLPMVGAIVGLWHLALTSGETGMRRRGMLAAGVLAGMLPMLHAHGFFAVGLGCGVLMLVWRVREWLWFVVPAGILAGPQALWLSRTGVRSTLFRPHLWWEAGDSAPLLFWLVNNGVFIGVLVVVLVVALLRWREMARFVLPFQVWFVVPNLVMLAPWAWDNIKVLVFWALVSSGVVALGVAWLAVSRRVLVRMAGWVLLAGLVLTGVIDVVRGLSPVERVQIFSRGDMVVAQRIREGTPPGATILHAPIHNSPVALTGRRSLMGYAGHLWSHGIEWEQRDADLKAIFAFGSGAEELLERYGVDYVLIGPTEVAQCAANDEEFATRYPMVFNEGGTRLFRIR